ncbi:hypothetical protein AAZV13_08G081200 [Glycine max]|uniref:DNA polymerase eta isoform X1 n=1 Tax=Glycine max TaxID=3847 RepID=UPI0003DEAB9F|nr:DNA polymerase eta isoform X1 [Glycine max]|eukprot:XP_006585046.1 DNA polymerase eta isoform X1 [Glycine max]
MPVARRETCDGRVIAHVDMDCFYVQVEQRKQPNLRGLPSAVIQYNSYKGGALIAVSYEARRCGVKRLLSTLPHYHAVHFIDSMRGDEAKEACPQIQLVQVPVARGKADLNSYRNAGSEVVSVLSQKGRCERASIDEVYLDLTHAAETMLMETPLDSMQDFEDEVLKSHVLGLEIKDGSDAKDEVRKWLCRSDASYQDKLLACGALIVCDLRMKVLKETEFTCSAGIAHNKMLAKLASAMNKPAQQTVVPQSSVEGLLASLPIKKMKHLGGKLGSSLQSDLGVNTVGDLLQFSEEKLQQWYGINTGTWLWNIARGISGEEVEGRLLPKSHGSGKTFPGPQALKTVDSVQHWLNQLCEELNERLHSDLDQNKRIAQTLTLHARAYKTGDSDSHRKFPSKSCPLRYGTRKIQEDALILFQAGLRDFLGFYNCKAHGNENNNWGVTSLSVSASKLVSIPSGTHSIVKYFGGSFPSSSTSNQSLDVVIDEAAPSSPSGSGNCSGLVPNEFELEYPEDTGMKDSKACLDQQDPLCHLSCKADGLTEESSLVSPSGSEDRILHNEPHRDLPATDLRRVSNISSLKAVGKKKTAGKKLQGNCSIVHFFNNYHNSQSSLEQKNVKISSSLGSHSADNSHSTCIQVEMPAEHPHEEFDTNKSRCSVGNMPQGRQDWSYNINEIDPSIINELPPEIQQEFQIWLRPHKRPNVAKRGSSITHYFSPDKSR